MSLGHELYRAAVAMHQEGVTPHEVAVRLVERAREHGVVCIVHRDSPPKLEMVLDGAEHVLQFDGARWRYDAPA